MLCATTKKHTNKLKKMTTLTNDQVREKIAESGKRTIKEMVDYIMLRFPNTDIKMVKAEAKDIKTNS